jgi:hypothetical protein
MLSPFYDALDIVQQRIDRDHASRRIRARPPIAPRPCLAFRLVAQVQHRSVDHRDAGPFGQARGRLPATQPSIG